MIEIAMQRTAQDIWVPHSEEDREKGRSFKINQICRHKITGYRDQRSLKQLKLYWAACRLTAESNDDPRWQSRENVDFQVKLALQYFKHDKVTVVGERVYFEAGSISYENMNHLQACNYMPRAYDIMSAKIGVDHDTFIEEVKRRCGENG